MRPLKKGDYQIRMPQVKELLEDKLIGLKVFNEELLRVEKITKIYYETKKINLGSILNPNYKEVEVVRGLEVASETKSTYSGGEFKFEPNTGTTWIEEIIPKRLRLLEKIENQLKYMK
jgi:hypothetical protein